MQLYEKVCICVPLGSSSKRYRLFEQQSGNLQLNFTREKHFLRVIERSPAAWGDVPTGRAESGASGGHDSLLIAESYCNSAEAAAAASGDASFSRAQRSRDMLLIAMDIKPEKSGLESIQRHNRVVLALQLNDALVHHSHLLSAAAAASSLRATGNLELPLAGGGGGIFMADSFHSMASTISMDPRGFFPAQQQQTPRFSSPFPWLDQLIDMVTLEDADVPGYIAPPVLLDAHVQLCNSSGFFFPNLAASTNDAERTSILVRIGALSLIATSKRKYEQQIAQSLEADAGVQTRRVSEFTRVYVDLERFFTYLWPTAPTTQFSAPPPTLHDLVKVVELYVYSLVFNVCNRFVETIRRTISGGALLVRSAPELVELLITGGKNGDLKLETTATSIAALIACVKSFVDTLTEPAETEAPAQGTSPDASVTSFHTAAPSSSSAGGELSAGGSTSSSASVEPLDEHSRKLLEHAVDDRSDEELDDQPPVRRPPTQSNAYQAPTAAARSSSDEEMEDDFVEISPQVLKLQCKPEVWVRRGNPNAPLSKTDSLHLTRQQNLATHDLTDPTQRQERLLFEKPHYFPRSVINCCIEFTSINWLIQEDMSHPLQSTGDLTSATLLAASNPNPNPNQYGASSRTSTSRRSTSARDSMGEQTSRPFSQSFPPSAPSNSTSTSPRGSIAAGAAAPSSSQQNNTWSGSEAAQAARQFRASLVAADKQCSYIELELRDIKFQHESFEETRPARASFAPAGDSIALAAGAGAMPSLAPLSASAGGSSLGTYYNCPLSRQVLRVRSAEVIDHVKNSRIRKLLYPSPSSAAPDTRPLFVLKLLRSCPEAELQLQPPQPSASIAAAAANPSLASPSIPSPSLLTSTPDTSNVGLTEAARESSSAAATASARAREEVFHLKVCVQPLRLNVHKLTLSFLLEFLKIMKSAQQQQAIDSQPQASAGQLQRRGSDGGGGARGGGSVMYFKSVHFEPALLLTIDFDGGTEFSTIEGLGTPTSILAGLAYFRDTPLVLYEVHHELGFVAASTRLPFSYIEQNTLLEYS